MATSEISKHLHLSAASHISVRMGLETWAGRDKRLHNKAVIGVAFSF